MTQAALADLGHGSVRRNALIADLLHRTGFIEKAGTGIRRIREEASEAGCPEPEFAMRGPFFVAIFRPATEVTTEVTPQVTPQVGILVQVISGEMSRGDLQEALELKDYKHFRTAYLRPALDAGLIEMTIPDKPRSSKQRYRTTAAGREYLLKSRLGEHPG